MADDTTPVEMPEPVLLGADLRDQFLQVVPTQSRLRQLTDKQLIGRLHWYGRWYDELVAELRRRGYVVAFRREGGRYADGTAASHGGVGDRVAVLPPRAPPERGGES